LIYSSGILSYFFSSHLITAFLTVFSFAVSLLSYYYYILSCKDSQSDFSENKMKYANQLSPKHIPSSIQYTIFPQNKDF